MEQKPFYAMNEQEVLNQLKTEAGGLSSIEANKRLESDGHNVLTESHKKSLWQKFLGQFKDFMIIVLLIAAVISMFAHEGGQPDPTDAIIILVVVLLNALLGVFQEAKAEEAIDALKKMASPEAKVMRDHIVMSISSEKVVKGDLVVLEAGDVVPADCRLIEVNSLKIEEAALTGESVSVEKSIQLLEAETLGVGDQTNMAFASTNVTYGRGLGVVVATAMDTQVGKIAHMLANTQESKTPLQENQDALGKWLTVMILVIATVIFAVGVLQGRNWTLMLLTAIAIAVAAIPEGLPAITTIILALGTQKMAKRNALVRTLPAVETLGGVQIICSDKTGTLTLNQMTVEKLMINMEVVDFTKPLEIDNKTLLIMNLANDTQIGENNLLIGDPTETALVKYGIDQGFDLKAVLSRYPRISEVPFDSTRKLMTTIHQLENNQYLIATKGAVDSLLNRCTQIEDKGSITSISNEVIEQIFDTNTKLATQALRVLGFGYKIVDALPKEINSKTIENDLVFTGLVGMIDPERLEAKEAIAVASQAGIKTVMITGDHKDTAKAIALRLNILVDENLDEVITGAQLDQMSDEELVSQVEHISVYARVSPEHKVRIVKAWQSLNKVVSMTGDGVNDAPSLKQADIGVGMGITGTEVSKGASDMVLADDNFETIVVAVEEGRKVFANIQKAVQFLLSANLGEVFTLFVATMLGWSILQPIHILWINLVTDVFPAISLGLEPAEADVMKHAPRGKQSNFLSNGVLPSILYQGFIEGGITLLIYWYANNVANYGHEVAMTMSFVTLGLIQLFHAFNVKSVRKSLFTVGFFKNRIFNFAVLLSAILLLSVLFVPSLSNVFDVTALNGIQWCISVVAGFSIIVIVEGIKFLLRRF